MVEFGEFFYDGVEIGNVKGFNWNRKSDSETLTIYKNDRNEGKLNIGSSGEYDVSIDSVEASPGMDETLYNACAAMVDSGSKTPLIINLGNKTLTFKNCHNVDWSETGDPSKPLEIALKFTATLVNVDWK
jgi:hypothetical protein